MVHSHSPTNIYTLAWRGICLALLLALLLTACQSQGFFVPAETTWHYATLRALDAVDAAQPSGDVIALYIRTQGAEFQIRLDLLDFSTPIDHDIYIALDFQPGGKTSLPLDQVADIPWDLLLHIPPDGAIDIWDDQNNPVQGIKLRVLRDPFLDTVEISIRSPENYLVLGPVAIQVYSAQTGSTSVTDIVEPISSQGSAPQPARVALGFWHTFQSTTSAQVLRSWDGAHSGPSSSRHGLNNLLTALSTYHVSAILLDLKTPDNVSALDYLGVLDDVLELSAQGLIILPDVNPAGTTSTQIVANSPLSPLALEWVDNKLAAENTKLLNQFDIVGSRFYYSPTPLQNPPEEYELFFNGSPTSAQSIYTLELFQWNDYSIAANINSGYAQNTIAGISDNGGDQASPAGPSLFLREAILMAAMDVSEPIILLGGDFSRTSWGNPSSAQNTLRYLVNHPWIQFIEADELLAQSPREYYRHHNLPTAAASMINTTMGQQIPSGLSSQQLQFRLLEALHSAPDNILTGLAWQMYQTLNFAPASEDIYALNVQYVGQIGHVLAAAEWADAPRIWNDCNIDIDWDGQTECVLASTSIFATFESEGGYLAYAFTRQANRFHQLIAPSYQVATGLSDPSQWESQYGLLADPGQFLGACADSIQNWQEYQPSIDHGAVRMISPDQLTTKLFELLPEGIRFTIYSSPEVGRQTIPLIVDPWLRFTPGWGSRYYVKDATWILESGPAISINTSADFSILSFSTLSLFANAPEDPNLNYPPGHFLPLPMAVIEVASQPSPIIIEISSSH